MDKVRLNLEKFVWSSPRKIAKEKSEILASVGCDLCFVAW
jgi:hypothetical protein